jgi:phage gpG-like protein
MTVTIQVGSLDALGSALMELANGLRVPVQDAMAETLQSIVQSNFGVGEGEDRPEPWQPLSQGYAKAAHGGDTTPTEILSGDMKDSIQVETGNPEYARVFTNCEYAAIQQWGGGEWNTPARPFFPIIGDRNTGTLTQHTQDELRQSAEEAIARHIKQ